MRTEAQANGYYELPSQYNQAHTLAKYGTWNYQTLRATPYWIMARVEFIWELNALCEKKQRKDTDQAMKNAQRNT